MSVIQLEKMSKLTNGDDRSPHSSKLKLAMASFQEFESLDSKELVVSKKSEKLYSSNVNTTSLFNGSEHDDSTVCTQSKGSYEVEENKFEEINNDFHIRLINLKPMSTKEVSKNDNGFSDDDLQSMMCKRISEKHESPMKVHKKSSESNKDQEYKKEVLLAEGSFGKVYRVCKRSTKEKFAMKVLSCRFLKKYNKSHEAYIEKHVLSSCKHPNIVKFHRCFTSGDSLCFLLELCEKGSLSSYLKQNHPCNEDEIRLFAAGIVNGLDFLHSRGIIHRDMKPSNLLLDQNNIVKIADFGTAKVFNCTNEQVNKALSKRIKREEGRSNSPIKKNSFVGTNEYISPEVLNGICPSYAVDLWGLGIILYQMYMGCTPFVGDNELETYENICRGNLHKPTKIPSDAWNLIKSLLRVDPRERIGCSDLFNVNYKEIKRHPYFSGIDFENQASLEKSSASSTQLSYSSNLQCESNEFMTPVREQIDKRASFVVPLPCDEEEEDFYVNRFNEEEIQPDESEAKEKPLCVSNKIQHKRESMKRCNQNCGGIDKIQSNSETDLTRFLIDDHFSFKIQPRKTT